MNNITIGVDLGKYPLGNYAGHGILFRAPSTIQFVKIGALPLPDDYETSQTTNLFNGKTKNEEFVYWVCNVLSHETIHQILWREEINVTRIGNFPEDGVDWLQMQEIIP